jgi:O-antigen/teichoic acid export membrane protein
MVIAQLQKKFSSQFVRNLGWLGIGQLLVRVFRLGTTVVLARMFTPHDYGLAAIVYTCYGFIQVFALGTPTGGIGAKIVQTKDKDLETICNTAYWLNWLICLPLAVVQCIVAFLIAWFYREEGLILPLCALSLMCLMYPMYKVHSGLIQRENRLRLIAICTTVEAILTNLITVGLALLGMGFWAVVWGLICSTPAPIIITLINQPWRPSKPFTITRWREVVTFGTSLMGIELMDKLRLNLDYLIIGRFLGMEALGTYFFAFNAGLGISKNILNSMMIALFPHLCAVRDNIDQMKQRYFSSVKTMSLIVIPLVLLQSSLAPFYVPIIFGAQWVSAIPILVVICLSAIPQFFAGASYQLLNAVGQVRVTLLWNCIYTVLFAVALLVAVRWGIFEVALAVLICQSANIFFCFWVNRSVFAKSCL